MLIPGIWIEDSYVIFGSDETKKLGILYSERPEASIKAVREWYTGREYEKIDSKWYTIGTWRHNYPAK